MNLKPGLWGALLALASSLCGEAAQSEATNQLSRADIIKKVDAKLHYKHGEVSLPGGLAKLSLPSAFRYINPEDSQFVLESLWGNPKGDKTLGMIFPSDVSPADPESWGVILTYSDDGHIKDADADSINYDTLLRDMREAVSEGNKERIKNGYGSIELIGWAAPPHYDKESRKMYWAKEIKFSDSETNTLNYNIRVLGRKGVLNLNAVSPITALPLIEKSAPDIVKMVNFTTGNTYADFDAKTDHVAAYGLAALVAGGIAAKAGFFKVLIGVLIAAKKFVIIGVIAVFSFFKKFMSGGWRKSTPSD